MKTAANDIIKTFEYNQEIKLKVNYPNGFFIIKNSSPSIIEINEFIVDEINKFIKNKESINPVYHNIKWCSNGIIFITINNLDFSLKKVIKKKYDHGFIIDIFICQSFEHKQINYIKN